MSPGNDDAANSGEVRGARAKHNGRQGNGNGEDHPNTSAAQRARILAWLQAGRSLTTLEARRELDVLHPAGRVEELRKSGELILTTWVREATDVGREHRVARYSLGVQS